MSPAISLRAVRPQAARMTSQSDAVLARAASAYIVPDGCPMRTAEPDDAVNRLGIVPGIWQAAASANAPPTAWAL